MAKSKIKKGGKKGGMIGGKVKPNTPPNRDKGPKGSKKIGGGGTRGG